MLTTAKNATFRVEEVGQRDALLQSSRTIVPVDLVFSQARFFFVWL